LICQLLTSEYSKCQAVNVYMSWKLGQQDIEIVIEKNKNYNPESYEYLF
jgi:hypothetical protein